MPYIYKITNKCNEKSYVGKTLKSIEERWEEHLKDYKRERCEKRPLYNAMNKYGAENFTISILEQVKEDLINEREKYWIEVLGSFKKGYNATRGGDGRSYVDYDLIFALYNEGLNNKEIQNILGHDKETIRFVLERRGITEKERAERGIEKTCHIVAMLDKKTKEILKVFPSVRKAYGFLGKQVSGHIAEVCQGKRKSIYEYCWKYIPLVRPFPLKGGQRS